ncbi:hypothetical protein [Rubellicoccus peritrichatus]|uniref:Uncharacterized protein n=1 Tax=Rubellicoccus peritrichatus TaxID=3080537 RepID=A0AAQ3QUC6_9BACT|nr:hypothetical protein [Puniceicoccus sp. CR14]WOO42256.1 hypothetical protein RZN69_04085 [Puniceicoccus sp. CR14]
MDWIKNKYQDLETKVSFESELFEDAEVTVTVIEDCREISKEDEVFIESILNRIQEFVPIIEQKLRCYEYGIDECDLEDEENLDLAIEEAMQPLDFCRPGVMFAINDEWDEKRWDFMAGKKSMYESYGIHVVFEEDQFREIFGGG